MKFSKDVSIQSSLLVNKLYKMRRINIIYILEIKMYIIIIIDRIKTKTFPYALIANYIIYAFKHIL